jgi:hypothetical protein
MSERRALVASLARVEQMTKWLVKWKASNAVAATKFEITAPEPSPLGPLRNDVTEGDPSPSPLFLLPRLLSPQLGATINPTFITRNASRMTCFRAFLPAGAVEEIARQVTDHMQRRAIPSKDKSTGHSRPMSVTDVWAWIGQRLALSLEKRSNLRDHFKSVRLASDPSFSSFVHFDAGRTRRRCGGCLTIVTARFKAPYRCHCNTFVLLLLHVGCKFGYQAMSSLLMNRFTSTLESRLFTCAILPATLLPSRLSQLHSTQAASKWPLILRDCRLYRRAKDAHPP